MSNAANDTAELDSGWVCGLVFDDHRLFQGIPYAAPPVGQLRWRAPQPVEPWAGVRDATQPGSPSPQLPQPYSGAGSVVEDCLFLNVTSPRTAGAKPVMVWLHGGGGTNGEGAMYGARRLAVAEDVVVVTANYRLGIFGNFGYPGLSGGSFGIADQQAVLRWVQRNIAGFGGDPGNVTLFGESYGGLSVSAHLVAPGSADLFHRAIVQSGFPLMRPPANLFVPGSPAMPSMWLPVAELEGMAEHLVGQLGWVRPGGGDPVDQLRALPVEQLLQFTSAFAQPVFGNEVLPESPVQALSAGRFHRVPVLAGNARDEARFFVGLLFDGAGQPVTEDGYGKLLVESFDARAEEVARAYPLEDHATPSLAWSTVLDDAAWARSLWDLAQVLNANTPTYVYEFADRGAPPVAPFPEDFQPGAHHAAVLPYLFDIGAPAPLTPAQWQLAATMHRYWANFARSGDPNGPELAAWPRFTATDPHVQSLHPARIGRTDFAAEHRLDFWTS